MLVRYSSPEVILHGVGRPQTDGSPTKGSSKSAAAMRRACLVDYQVSGTGYALR